MKRNKSRAFRPLVIVFILSSGFFVAAGSLLKRWGADQEVLIIGNLILFAASLFAFLLASRGMKTKNPHAFVRSVYGSFMLKFFVCIGAAFIYIMMEKKNVNKPALFTCMGLYIVYSFLEVSMLTKISKQEKNA